MEYNYGDRFLFNFGPNGIPFGFKIEGSKIPSYSIQFEKKWKSTFFRVSDVLREISSQFSRCHCYGDILTSLEC